MNAFGAPRTMANARASRASVHNLSRMLWVFLAVTPTVPVLALYVPLRIVTERKRRALRRLVADHGDAEALRRVLAQRALRTMPYRDLLDGGGDPFADARGPRLQEHADAELARVGARPRATDG